MNGLFHPDISFFKSQYIMFSGQSINKKSGFIPLMRELNNYLVFSHLVKNKIEENNNLVIICHGIIL